MSRSPVPLRRAVLAAAVALAAVGAAAYPATASTTTRHPVRTPATKATATHLAALTGTQGVQLQLTPRDRAGLAQLATATGLSRTTRLQRLAPLVAGGDRADRVAATLRREGLTVTSSTGLSVDASGPAATVAALFGTAQSPGVASAQPLPRIPSALAGLVTVAYGGNDTRPAERALGIANNPKAGAGTQGTLTVAQARSLYGSAPSQAAPASTGPIIATLQFTTAAVVNQAITNVDTYAHQADVKIYADSSYQPSTNIAAVDVPDSCTENPSTDHGLDGDEVGLDQETLLTAAPQFRQRIYYAKNCGNTQDEALDQIVSDVQGGQPIVALSSSWGECEAYAYYGSSAAKQGDVDAVNSLLAAGVTMFAASGDSGSNDCNVSSAQDAVDTPGSIPGVVSVGGTTGTNTSALTVTNQIIGSQRLAGGGGFSCGYFARPSYQAAVARAAAYPHDSGSALPSCPSGTSERMVPDISEDAGDGLYAEVTDDYNSKGLSTYRTPILGTSFAAPLAAGGFATALFNRGITAGIGDIHGFLYAGHGFHDVTTGSNGDYKAATGYDVASGVGSPVWSQVLASGSDLADVSIASSGAVQVRSAYAGDAYQAASGVLTSGLTVSDPADWQFVTAPYAGDGAADLWAIQLGATGHSLQVFSQASGYRTRINDVPSIPTSLTAAETTVRIGSYAGDHRGDLYLIKTSDTVSKDIEIYGFSGGSRYQSRTVTATTPISAGNPDWTFLIGDKSGSGDLVGVLDGGTASGDTEVHILSRTSGYKTFTTHARTALGEYSGSPAAQFSLRDVTGDGVPDVVLSLVDWQSSDVVGVHALKAPTFGSFAYQRVTALSPVVSSDTVGLASTV